MLTVHHLNNSRSQRVLWLLEELEVPYEIVDRRAGDPSATFADPAQAEAVLGWRARQGLTKIVESAYRWHSKSSGR